MVDQATLGSGRNSPPFHSCQAAKNNEIAAPTYEAPAKWIQHLCSLSAAVPILSMTLRAVKPLTAHLAASHPSCQGPVLPSCDGVPL